jgi:TonB family protein
MNKVIAVTVGMMMLGAVPAHAECSTDNLITPVVAVANGYEAKVHVDNAWPVIDTFKQNHATVCINQDMTTEFAPRGMLWVHYKAGLGERDALVVEKDWRRVDAPAAGSVVPFSGGTEKASYESLLMGLISRQLHLPPEVRAQHSVGQIGLFVDELGNLTRQALYRASGQPALDNAWMTAVRHAAPFPAPPRGLPHGFILQYTNQD